jgi:hypothetical protein
VAHLAGVITTVLNENFVEHVVAAGGSLHRGGVPHLDLVRAVEHLALGLPSDQALVALFGSSLEALLRR